MSVLSERGASGRAVAPTTARPASRGVSHAPLTEYPGLRPVLSELRDPQYATDEDTGEPYVTGHDTILYALCPEHGERADYYPVPPSDTSEFCAACAAEVDRWYRAKRGQASREPHEDRELRLRVDSLTGRPAA